MQMQSKRAPDEGSEDGREDWWRPVAVRQAKSAPLVVSVVVAAVVVVCVAASSNHSCCLPPRLQVRPPLQSDSLQCYPSARPMRPPPSSRPTPNTPPR